MKQFKMNEHQRFSIRKFSIGAASVLLGSVFFVANPATEVQAAEANTEVVAQDRDVKPDNSSALSSSETSSQNPSVGQAGTEAETQGREKKEPGTPSKDGEGKAKVEETSTEGNSKLELNKEIAEKQDQPKTDIKLSRQLNTQNLESLLSEIDAIKTENYTEESVAALKAKAEEARQVLATAQNQTEVDAAFRTLVSYKNTGLRRVKKDVEPKAPKLDTTNGKATVGLRAENTEPNGTNIAGHNHSLNGTTFTEGSGFRAIPEGDVTLSHYDRSLTTEVGKAPDARFLLKWRKGQGYSPQVTTGGIGIYLEYERQLPNTGNFVERIFYSKGSTNTVGSYRAVFRMADRSNGTVYGYQGFDITVKPLAPKVTIENLDNTAGKISKVTATARNSSDSSVDFYVNGAKKATVKASNGIAEWTPTEVFNANDRVSATNTARDKEYLEGETIGGTTRIPISTATSNMSSEVVIPTPVAPAVNKDELQALVDEAPGIKTTAAYYNAPENNRNAYDEAITNGKTALNKPDVQQEELNTNRDAITEAKKGLTGQATNTQELQALVDEAANKASNAKYYNATQDKQTAYDQAITKAQEVLKKANVTQAEINAEKGKVEAAKTGLDGQATNTQELQALVDEAANKASNAKYYNATQDKQTAYDQAIAKAQEVLNKANVTQAEINAEKGKVEAAKNALDGAETNKTDLQTLVDEAANTVLSYKYHNADKDKKDAFDKAIEKAKAVLDDVYASQKSVAEARDNLKLAKESLNGIYIPPYTPQADQPQPSTPTQPDQGATETPTVPSEPAPQPSQPTVPSQPASPAPAPTQAPRAAARPSASSTSTQAPAQEQVDKSELRALSQELDQRLKALATVSDPKIDAAKAVLLDAQKALEDSALTEQGLRTAVESVKAALDSLKDVKANTSDSKPAQDKKDAKQGTEDSKDSDKMTETNSVPAGVIVVSLLALLGVIAFWLVRRKKESEIQQLSTELTKVLGQLDAEKADKKVLAKAQKLLQETLDFVKEENGSAETEAKLVEELKAILAKLK